MEGEPFFEAPKEILAVSEYMRPKHSGSEGPVGLCWGFATHMKCKIGSRACGRPHRLFPPDSQLHWTVRYRMATMGGRKENAEIQTSGVCYKFTAELESGKIREDELGKIFSKNWAEKFPGQTEAGWCSQCEWNHRTEEHTRYGYGCAKEVNDMTLPT